MSTPYQEVVYLEKNGHWEGNKAPDWAMKMADKAGTSPASGMIREWAKEQEIIRLRGLVQESYKEGGREVLDERLRTGVTEDSIESDLSALWEESEVCKSLGEI